MVLPALAADPAGSHGGTWKAHFALRSPADVGKLASSRPLAGIEMSPQLSDFLPYSLVVHATSNIQLNAWRLQESFTPGAAVNVFASLKEYDQPLRVRASVWAEVERPDTSTFTIKLLDTGSGGYEASFPTSRAGVYKCRVMAEGNSTKGLRFTREKTLTAGVYHNDDQTGGGDNSSELICRLLHCVFEEHEVLRPPALRRLAQLGFDMKQFIACIEEVCPEWSAEKILGIKHRLTEEFLKRPQLVSNVRFAAQVTSRPIEVPKMPKPKKHEGAHTPNMPGSMMPTMFTPLDLKVEEKRAVVEPALKGTGKTQASPKRLTPKPPLNPRTPARTKVRPKPPHQDE